MKVYVVTQGDYSDYHICGVAVKKSVAEEIVRRIKRSSRFYSDVRIEEYNTDEYEGICLGNLTAYHIRLSKMGNIIDIRELEEREGICFTEYNQIDSYREGYSINVVARDETHAKKIAQDKLAEFKYLKEVESE